MLTIICIPVTYSKSLTKAKLNSADLQRAIVFYKDSLKITYEKNFENDFGVFPKQ